MEKDKDHEILNLRLKIETMGQQYENILNVRASNYLIFKNIYTFIEFMELYLIDECNAMLHYLTHLGVCVISKGILV